MRVLWAILGVPLGAGLAFGFYFGIGSALGFPWYVALICAIPAAVYSPIALASGVYEVGFFSILGYVLDMTWSVLNTLVGLIYIPVCLLAGGGFQNDSDTRRSGCFCYLSSPRGPGWIMTLGTTIGGGWNRHEEVHVWQARMFGPVYFPIYGLCWLLNVIFRLITGKVADAAVEAYRRVCFEDWAYAAGGDSEISWGLWFLWFLICTVYVGLGVSIVVGFAAHAIVVGLVAIGVLLVYSLVRAFTPTYS
jgi:hypothetical protein